jgi:hypothetical protein
MVAVDLTEVVPMQMRVLKSISIGAAVAAWICVAGCNHAAAPVKNADGTTTNPNGSVTVPASQAKQMPLGEIDSQKAKQNPDGSVTFPADSPTAQQEKQQTTPNGPPPAPGAGPVVASSSPAPQPAPAPAEPAAAPAPVAATAPAGSHIAVRITEGLAASRNNVGDRFTGVLERPLMSHGEVVFDRGTPVAGEVVAAKRKGHFAGAGDLGIEVTAIGKDHVETSEYEAVAKGRGKRSAGFIGGGAGLGAIIGGIAGGGKGALIGGLAGGGAGTAAGAYTGSRDVVIPSETVITFRLRTAVTRG